ncbi:MAG: hypothetical protein R3B35_15055 [Gemmatimonadales bacterium]
MHLRGLSLATLLLASLPLAAQDPVPSSDSADGVALVDRADGSACERIGYSPACAVQAAGVAGLASLNLDKGQREIRFWRTSGMHWPESVVVLEQRGDSVAGRLLLTWPADVLNPEFRDSICRERWTGVSGEVCVGRLHAPLDVGAIFRQLDEAGLSAVPGAPVPDMLDQPCDRTPTPPPAGEPGRLPMDRLCPMVLDGVSELLEVRTGAEYWRYRFPRIPDTTASDLHRDQVLLGILRRASAYRSTASTPAIRGP